MTNFISDYERAVAQNLLDFPNWRYGQTLFNTLFETKPDLAEKIIGTEIDPFHMLNNERGISDFWAWLFNEMD